MLKIFFWVIALFSAYVSPTWGILKIDYDEGSTVNTQARTVRFPNITRLMDYNLEISSFKKFLLECPPKINVKNIQWLACNSRIHPEDHEIINILLNSDLVSPKATISIFPENNPIYQIIATLGFTSRLKINIIYDNTQLESNRFKSIIICLSELIIKSACSYLISFMDCELVDNDLNTIKYYFPPNFLLNCLSNQPPLIVFGLHYNKFSPEKVRQMEASYDSSGMIFLYGQ